MNQKDLDESSVQEIIDIKGEVFFNSLIEKYTCKFLEIPEPELQSEEVLLSGEEWDVSRNLLEHINDEDTSSRETRFKNKMFDHYNKIHTVLKESKNNRKALPIKCVDDVCNDFVTIASLENGDYVHTLAEENYENSTPLQLIERSSSRSTPRSSSRSTPRSSQRSIARSSQRSIARSSQRSIARSHSRSTARSTSRSSSRSPSRSHSRSHSRSTARTPSRSHSRSTARSHSRSTARSPSRSTARSPSRSTARSHSRSHSRSTARSTARSPLWSTPRSPLRSTTRFSLRSTTRSSLRSTARSSLRSTARSSLRSTARSSLRSTARSSLRSTARSSLRSTARYSLRSNAKSPPSSSRSHRSAPRSYQSAPKSIARSSRSAARSPSKSISRSSRSAARSPSKSISRSSRSAARSPSKSISRSSRSAARSPSKSISRSSRSAARSPSKSITRSSWSAARSPSRSTARSHSRSTARSHSRSTARSHLRSTSKSSLRSTARPPLLSTSRSPLRSTPRSPLRLTTRSSLRSTTRSSLRSTARSSLRSTARSSLRSTARSSLPSTARSSLRSTARSSLRSTAKSPPSSSRSHRSAPRSYQSAPKSIARSSRSAARSPSKSISRSSWSAARSPSKSITRSSRSAAISPSKSIARSSRSAARSPSKSIAEHLLSSEKTLSQSLTSNNSPWSTTRTQTSSAKSLQKSSTKSKIHSGSALESDVDAEEPNNSKELSAVGNSSEFRNFKSHPITTLRKSKRTNSLNFTKKKEVYDPSTVGYDPSTLPVTKSVKNQPVTKSVKTLPVTKSSDSVNYLPAISPTESNDYLSFQSEMSKIHNIFHKTRLKPLKCVKVKRLNQNKLGDLVLTTYYKTMRELTKQCRKKSNSELDNMPIDPNINVSVSESVRNFFLFYLHDEFSHSWVRNGKTLNCEFAKLGKHPPLAVTVLKTRKKTKLKELSLLKKNQKISSPINKKLIDKSVTYLPADVSNNNEKICEVFDEHRLKTSLMNNHDFSTKNSLQLKLSKISDCSKSSIEVESVTECSDSNDSTFDEVDFGVKRSVQLMKRKSIFPDDTSEMSVNLTLNDVTPSTTAKKSKYDSIRSLKDTQPQELLSSDPSNKSLTLIPSDQVKPIPQVDHYISLERTTRSKSFARTPLAQEKNILNKLTCEQVDFTPKKTSVAKKGNSSCKRIESTRKSENSPIQNVSSFEDEMSKLRCRKRILVDKSVPFKKRMTGSNSRERTIEIDSTDQKELLLKKVAGKSIEESKMVESLVRNESSSKIMKLPAEGNEMCHQNELSETTEKNLTSLSKSNHEDVTNLSNSDNEDEDMTNLSNSDNEDEDMTNLSKSVCETSKNDCPRLKTSLRIIGSSLKSSFSQSQSVDISTSPSSRRLSFSFSSGEDDSGDSDSEYEWSKAAHCNPHIRNNEEMFLLPPKLKLDTTIKRNESVRVLENMLFD